MAKHRKKKRAPVAARASLADPKNAAPIFVWAPSARCGITLLQRLIASSGQVLMFGEYRLLSGVLPRTMMETSAIGAEADAARQRLVAGDYNFWAGSALPPAKQLVSAIARGFYEIVAEFEASARADGFERWGLKHPGAEPRVMHDVIAKLLPRSRHVYVHRHIDEVLASYKSRRWIASAADTRRVANTWANNLRQILDRPEDDATLVLRYDELVRNPGETLPRLAAHLSLPSIDETVLAHKVNTFEGEREAGHAEGGYVEPSALAEDDRRLAREVAGETMQAAGYMS